MPELQKSPKLLPLTNDAVFKLYFTREENRPQLRQFLKAATHLIDDDLETMEIKNPTLTKEQVQDKDFIVDIHLTSKTGHKVIIELQVQKHSNFIERVTSYNARSYSSQLKRGEFYDQLKETISVIIVDFPMFDDTQDYYEHILFRRKNGKPFTNAQQFYIIDLTKLPATITKPLHRWGKLIGAKTMEEIEMLSNQDEEMKKASENLIKLSADDDAQFLAEHREYCKWAAERELHAREQLGRTEGRAEGRAEERAIAEAEKIEIAKKFLKMGLTLDQVVAGTDLSIQEVEKIASAVPLN